MIVMIIIITTGVTSVNVFQSIALDDINKKNTILAVSENKGWRYLKGESMEGWIENWQEVNEKDV